MGSLSKVDISMERTSAHIIIEKVLEWIHPKEVIQLGCGEGIWLQEFKSRGIAINGVDSEDYARTSFWQENPSEFLAADLREQVVSSPDRLDLAISLETANKLEEDKAREFVRSLCNLSDVVLFSAAVPGQNEDDANAQMQSYWVKIFKENGYLALDCIRSKVWDDEQIDVRYRQNIIVYVKQAILSKYPLLFEFYIKSRKCFTPDVLHPKAKLRSASKKILYAYVHSGAFGWVLIHRLFMYPLENAYLMMPSALLKISFNAEVIQKFVDRGVFKKVYTYDWKIGRNGTTIQMVENEIKTGMEKTLLEQNCDIKSFDKIYSLSDFKDSLGIFFAMNNIPFEWFEMGPDVLSVYSEESVRAFPLLKSWPVYRDALLKYKTTFGGYDKQRYVIFPSSKKRTFPLEKCSYFDPNIAVEMLPEARKSIIGECFNIANIPHEINSAWIIAKSSWTGYALYDCVPLLKKRYTSSRQLYYASIQTVIDYFVPADCTPVLKLHPSNPIEKETINRYFLGIYEMSNLFSMPLTKILTEDYMPNYYIVSNSTASAQITDKGNIIYSGGTWLFPLFYQKFVVAVQLLRYLEVLCKSSGDRFMTIGEAGDVENFDDMLSSDINSYIEVQFPDVQDDCDLNYSVMQLQPEHIKEIATRRSFVIYTDVWEYLSIANLLEIKKDFFVSVIKISKNPFKDIEDIIVPMQDEYIFFIAKEDTYAKRLENFFTIRKNNAMGIELIAQNISWEDYLGECKNS